jgi:hypothetical protein
VLRGIALWTRLRPGRRNVSPGYEEHNPGATQTRLQDGAAIAETPCMSRPRDAWASGPSMTPPAPAGIPDRPDVPGIRPNPWVRSVVQPTTLTGSYASAPAWKRFGAGLGVFWAFLFFLTIPGWFALAHFKKWRRGEIPTPNGLIIWGLGFSGFVAALVLLTLASPH